MNKFIGATIVFFLLMASNSFSEEKDKAGVVEKLKNATCEGFFFGIKAGKDCEKEKKLSLKLKRMKLSLKLKRIESIRNLTLKREFVKDSFLE